jgi:hypothetical protein
VIASTSRGQALECVISSAGAYSWTLFTGWCVQSGGRAMRMATLALDESFRTRSLSISFFRPGVASSPTGLKVVVS